MRDVPVKPPGARRAARPLAAALVVAALLGGGRAARAEFKVGAELPDFSLKTADGAPFSLGREKGRLFITNGARRLEPTVVVLHLFQPDCLQCQAQMRELEKVQQEFSKQGVLVVGVAHRGDARAVRAAAGQFKVTFPVLVGTDSALAREFAAGDALAIADGKGVARFAQVGYGQGDEKAWREDVERLLAGKPVARETIARARLRVGDRLPPIELASAVTGKPMALSGRGGRLTFIDEEGKAVHPRAAVGFFSRY
jgi:peroxiredoxin